MRKILNAQVSRKTGNSTHNRAGRGQKHVRKPQHVGRDHLDVERLKINLGHLVKRLSVGGKVQAYEFIAGRLSKLAGLELERAWGWRYIASIHSRSIAPSRKFLRVLGLYMENFNPLKKQWFYFASRRHSVAAIHDRAVLGEIIRTHMQAMGYKAVSFSQYARTKRTAVFVKHGGRA